MIKKILIAVFLLILSSFLIWQLYKFLYTPRIVFGAKGFTEYSPGSPGKVFVQVLDNYFSPVNNAICKLTVYYPNGTKFINNVTMLPFENGLYYWDFVAPDVQGVYMTTISCTYPSQLQILTPSDSKLWYRDGSEVSTSNYMTTITTTAPSNTAELIVYFSSIDANNPVAIYINNTATNQWDYLGQATVNTPQVSFTFDLATHNPITVWLTANKNFGVDMLNVYVYQNATQVQTNLRGGGEIHVEVKKVAISPDENIEIRPLS